MKCEVALWQLLTEFIFERVLSKIFYFGYMSKHVNEFGLSNNIFYFETLQNIFRIFSVLNPFLV